MCAAAHTGDVIILSDDEDDEASLLIVEVEEVKKPACSSPPSALDEDLVVTFSRRGELLPHARYDCPIHLFTAADRAVQAPVASNALFCEQCYCYVCDKLASSCERWSCSGVCHSNSHKRSDFWNNVRNTALLGELRSFNLTLSEVDAPLRRADAMLKSFRSELAVCFSSFRKGWSVQVQGPDGCEKGGLAYNYTKVYECVSSFLNEAEKQEDRAAAIMALGAAQDFIRHFQVSGDFAFQSPMANAAEAKVLLLQRVISSTRRRMVMADFTADFSQKLQDFYKKLSFTAEVKSLRNSLSIRHWDDVLLGTVLRGQNVTGKRTTKGSKDVLIEEVSVVLLRAEVLQQKRRYRDLCRYLQVVQADDSKRLQQVQDLMPFFRCLQGDLTFALHSLFPHVNAPATRLSPQLFLFYFRIFKTATAPQLTVTEPDQLCSSEAVWEPIRGAVQLKPAELVKFVLRAQRCCAAVFTDSQCWTCLLSFVSLRALPAPSTQFLHDAKIVVNSILLDIHGSNFHIPHFFMEVYSDHALLLLATGALSLRIVHSALRPALPVLNTFQEERSWALRWLWESLPSERLSSFMQELNQEMTNSTGEDNYSLFLHHNFPTLPSSTEPWDHTYCTPVAVNPLSTQVTVLSHTQP